MKGNERKTKGNERKQKEFQTKGAEGAGDEYKSQVNVLGVLRPRAPKAPEKSICCSSMYWERGRRRLLRKT